MNNNVLFKLNSKAKNTNMAQKKSLADSWKKLASNITSEQKITALEGKIAALEGTVAIHGATHSNTLTHMINVNSVVDKLSTDVQKLTAQAAPAPAPAPAPADAADAADQGNLSDLNTTVNELNNFSIQLNSFNNTLGKHVFDAYEGKTADISFGIQQLENGVYNISGELVTPGTIQLLETGVYNISGELVTPGTTQLQTTINTYLSQIWTETISTIINDIHTILGSITTSTTIPPGLGGIKASYIAHGFGSTEMLNITRGLVINSDSLTSMLVMLGDSVKDGMKSKITF